MYNFTQEDLLQYLYNEASAEKTAEIKTALASDWSLREKMDLLSSAHQELNTIKLSSPRKQTIDNILNYAEKSIAVLSEEV
ncbi:MAG: hypothetical protein ABJA37_05020 [Ferruginibacter sp.]